MACGCPDAVVFALRGRVQSALDQVRAIIDLSTFLNRALEEIAGIAADALDGILPSIPSVPAIDFSDILSYLSCPLTPLALALGDLEELTALDSNVQLRKLRTLAKSSIDQARQDYEDALDAAPERQVIGLLRKYVNEITRVRFDETVFAEAVLIAASVLSLCGEEEYQEGPYQDFANNVQGFSMTGGVPSSLDPNVGAAVQRLLVAEAQFKAAAAALV